MDKLKELWRKAKYWMNYPASSENPVVQDYLRRKHAIVTRRNFFSPSQDEIDALYGLSVAVRGDASLDEDEREALLGLIAFPGWFMIER